MILLLAAFICSHQIGIFPPAEGGILRKEIEFRVHPANYNYTETHVQCIIHVFIDLCVASALIFVVFGTTIYSARENLQGRI